MNRNQRAAAAHRPSIALKAGGVALLSARSVQFWIRQ